MLYGRDGWFTIAIAGTCMDSVFVAGGYIVLLIAILRKAGACPLG